MGEQERVFLFLQGPTGSFFRNFGQVLLRRGHKVIRVNLSGGDFIDWYGPETRSYRGRYRRWSSWVAALMIREGVTDLLVMQDHRSRHMEAVEIAKFLRIRVFSFEEGYIRPHYITMEEGGVNGNSGMPRTRVELRRQAQNLPDSVMPEPLPGKMDDLVRHTVRHIVGRFAFWPLFPFYVSYRPYSIFKEYILGWIPRMLTRQKQAARSTENMRRLRESGRPFYLFPLQLDTDSQVRLFSPFSGMREGISRILVSFAKHAPKHTALLVKNHPLDCGIINYYRYVREYAKALGVAHRVFFIEHGNNDELIREAIALVMLNSTFGTLALMRHKPVYYVGRGICALQGLGCCEPHMTLKDFWGDPTPPDPEVLEDFLKVLKAKAVINGDFVTSQGQQLAIQGAMRKLDIA